jgi:ABC-type transport system involved in cytochrome c biogenesis permease subunit
MRSLIEPAIYTAFIFYTAGSFLNFAGLKSAGNKVKRAAFIASAIGLAFNLAALTLRTVMANRLPLTSGYEFILVFTFITVFIYLVYELKSEITSAGGVIMLIASMMILSVIIITGGDFVYISPLMPSLKSPWLTVHVLTAAAAYASFALAAGFGLIQLTKTSRNDLEASIYRLVATGFAILSLSIVLGAIWAEQAWGSYWSWDPKEVWALITWIIYAIFLHLHSQKGLRGRKANILVIAGFALVLFTFFGVNYLLPGLHSYALIIEKASVSLLLESQKPLVGLVPLFMAINIKPLNIGHC